MSGLAPREMELLRRLAVGAKLGVVARDMGLAYSTASNMRSGAYQKLGAQSLQAALLASGLVALRDECGWVARCTRPAGHRGHHGGFRPVAQDAAGVWRPADMDRIAEESLA